MYPISSAVKALFDAEQRQVLRITGTDKNGASIYITDADIMQGSFSIDRFSCNGNKIEVGTAIASELEFKLNNTDGRFNSIVFEGAELFVEIGIADWTQDNPTINWIPCGYYTPDQQPRRLDIITIKAMDRMQLLDKTQPAPTPWTTNTLAVITDDYGNEIDFNTYVRFPNTVIGIIDVVCTFCGVTLGQDISSLPNATYTLAYMPQMQQQVTFRNLIQWCAGIMGTNAWFDWNGLLRFSWYDNVTDYESTTANRYSSDYFENDITITGVQYTNAQNVVIVSGSADYALDLKDNLLVAPFIAEVLPVLRNALSGYTYRPFTASAINAPYLWPMDVVTFTDKDGIEYESALTNVNFGINGATWLESVGETEQTNSSVAPTQLTPEQAQLINEAINSTQELSDSLDQEGVFNRLTNNGEAQGIYMQDGKLYINLTYARAGTLVLGGLNDQNGLLQVLNATGEVIGFWNNNGLSATGQFTSKSTNGQFIVEISNGEIRLINNNIVVGKIQWSAANSYRPNSVVFNGDTASLESSDSQVIVNDKNIDLVCTNLSMTQLDSNGDYVIDHTGYTGTLQFDDGDGITHIIEFLNGIVWSVS